MRFVLVHGGFHGAWCWQWLVTELGRRGHEAVAMDLPGHGDRRDEVPTLDSYRDAVVEHLEPGDILVGHSMGFCVAVLAADAFPNIGHIVNVAGPLPIEGQPILAAQGLGPNTGAPETGGMADDFMRLSADGQYISLGETGARELFYHDCSLEMTSWAFERLTPQRIDVLVCEPVSVPTFWSADLPRSCVRCLNDRALIPEKYDSTIERLGVVPLTIDSSHTPLLSRPADLAEILVEAVHTKPVGPLSPT